MKRKTLALLLCAALLLTACAASPAETAEKPTETTAPPTTQPVETAPPATTVPPTTVPVETAPLGSLENPYEPGMYKVGVDIPAGEYAFVAYYSSAYVCVSADSNQNDILENENFSNTFIITVADGQYLEANRCGFVRADEVVMVTNDDGSFSDGMYRVGIDIPAGEYKLTSDNGGYYCVYPNSVPPFDIVDNDLFDTNTYVTVKDGQYLLLSRCTAVPAN